MVDIADYAALAGARRTPRDTPVPASTARTAIACTPATAATPAC